MSEVYGWQRGKQIRKAEAYNVGKPPSKRRRVPHWKQIDPDPCESSNTVSSSSGADNKYPFFERSMKIPPHALVHFADQVIMGGTHSFHNTAATESSHPRCIAQAALRSRTYHDVNVSSQKMLHYQMDKNQMQQIIQCAAQKQSDTSHPRVLEVLPPTWGPFPLQKLKLTNQIKSSKVAELIFSPRGEASGEGF